MNPSAQAAINGPRLAFKRHTWIAFVALAIAASSAIFPKLWTIWQFNTYPSFIDASVIAAGAESVRHHIDPLYKNPFDQRHRTLNYPRVWQSLAVVVGQGSTPYLAFSFWAAFFVALAGFLRRAGPSAWWLLLLTCCSPCVMLALERGNCDLLIWALMVGAAFAKERSWTLSALIWLLAVMLKLYPLFAAPFLIQRVTRREFILAGLAVAAVGIYELQHLQDLVAIRAGTPDAPDGYGRSCITQLLQLVGHTPSPLFNYIWMTVLVTPFALGLRLFNQSRGGASQPPNTSRSLSRAFFLIGAWVFLGTFLIGTNQEYRLMWLTLCIPHCWQCARTSRMGTLGWIAIVSILLAQWSLVVIKALPLLVSSELHQLLVIQALKSTAYVSIGALAAMTSLADLAALKSSAWSDRGDRPATSASSATGS